MKASTAKQFIFLACCQSAAAFSPLRSLSASCPALHQPRTDIITSLTQLQADANEAESDTSNTSNTSNENNKASSSFIDDDEYVSPNQIKELRKEVAKRRARRELAHFKLPASETFGEFTEETLTAVCNLLAKNELVEVRGISRDKKREVFATTEELGLALSEQGNFVTVVEQKGFASTFYCPGDDEVVGKKIIRRTSFKEGQWTKKPKPKRDNKGQIIKGEYEYFD